MSTLEPDALYVIRMIERQKCNMRARGHSPAAVCLTSGAYDMVRDTYELLGVILRVWGLRVLVDDRLDGLCRVMSESEWRDVERTTSYYLDDQDRPRRLRPVNVHFYGEVGPCADEQESC